MKRTLILLGVILFVSVCAFAQRGGMGGGRPSGGGSGGGIGNRQGMPPQGTARNGGGTSQRPPNADNRNGGQGQSGDSTERHRNRQMEPGRLLKGLDLSKEQKNQIKQIQKTAKENGTSPEEVRSQISQVLTPEQKEKLKERIEKIKDRKEQGPPPNGQNQPQ